MKIVDILLFEHFTMLDALGPAEVFGRLPDDYKIRYVSVKGGQVAGSTGLSVLTDPVSATTGQEIFLIPGGWGTRALVKDERFIETLGLLCHRSEFVLSVCTGAALLARSGYLDQKHATSNKMAWDWVVGQSDKVKWNKKARWVVDGELYSSAGITAGIDMCIGFLSDRHGVAVARSVARSLEYVWNEDKNLDLF